MFCPKCGAPNDTSARFCSTCGAAMPAQQPMQSTQPIPVVVQQVRPAPVQLVPAHPTAYTHALTGCGRSLSYLFAAIALTAVAVLHLLDLLLGISGGIESVRTAIDASPSGLMQFLQAAFWLPELLTVIGVWSAAGACRSRSAQISTGGLNCLRTAAVFRIIFEALELTFLLIYLLFLAVGILYSHSAMSAFTSWLMWAAMLTVYVALHTVLTDRRRMDVALFGVSVAAGGVGGIACIQYFLRIACGFTGWILWCTGCRRSASIWKWSATAPVPPSPTPTLWRSIWWR